MKKVIRRPGLRLIILITALIRKQNSAEDICQFLLELDGMELVPGKEDKDFYYFVLELLCPIKGKDYEKKFRLIFTTSKNEMGIIGTITLYRVK